MTAALRLVTATPSETRKGPLRPTSFDNYVGQRDTIDSLRMAVRAARRGGWQLDHVLVTGPKGLGKTSLCQVIANELGVEMRATSAPAISHKGQLASILTSLATGDVLFIDEIHRLKVPLQETLYTAMEDGVLDMATGNTIIRVPLPRFTLTGATTHAGMLSAPLLDRFGFSCQLRFYDVADLATIVLRSAATLQIELDADGAMEIARRSRGTPRLANRLLRRVRDFVLGAEAANEQPHRQIGRPLVIAACSKLSVDDCGLDSLDRAYLAIVSRGAIGIEAIARSLSEQRTTIEDIVEPLLVQLGFVARTARGRVLTDAGLRHWRGQQAAFQETPGESATAQHDPRS